jgi:hypothetical protein
MEQMDKRENERKKYKRSISVVRSQKGEKHPWERPNG